MTNKNLKFIIIADERSGTNLLTRMLNEHPDITVLPEPFRHPKQFGLTKKGPLAPFLKAIFKNAEGVGIHRVSHTGQNLPKQWQSVWSVLPKMYPNIKCISLTRTNLLRRLVSLEVAKTLKKWIDIDSTPETLPNVTITPEYAKRNFKIMGDAYASRHRQFKDVLHITYEDLTGDMEATSRKIQAYLNLDYVDIAPVTKKRETRTLKEAVTNYEQLKTSMFDIPKWHGFFE